ncbi:MAG TPA: YDG/SRA domain-containing protein [Chitinophagaceae bacterium]|jgi:putative restriction endonuclease|nr:YDG/SRA domain-containing protein [Chitinophagaceae bacterium]
MANYTFGGIEGVEEGTSFLDRKALRMAGIHLALVAGIDGNPEIGASSVVLNGGYVDDSDLGDQIIYTGHGGNDPNSKKQVSDQSWDAPGNKALLVSEMHGLPIRVTRGYKLKSNFSPKSGYRYGGLYRVADHFEEKGKDGFMICRYRLEKIEPFNTKPGDPIKTFSSGSDDPGKSQVTFLRTVRDTKLSREIKELYEYKCQVCGIEISVRGVAYAEGAHIRPLGKPHNGKDKSTNIICLCPNHHVMFDKGIFSIGKNLHLVGLKGKLNLHVDHKLDEDNLAYHEEHIYIEG